MNLAQQTMWSDTVSGDEAKEAERFDWYAEFCKARYGCSPDWRVARWEAKGDHSNPDAPGNFVLVTGAVYPELITKGKRKGGINYKVTEPGTERTFPVLDSDLKQFKLEWQELTGKCYSCFGTGLQWAGWDHIAGNRYRQCRRCKPAVSSEDRQTGE